MNKQKMYEVAKLIEDESLAKFSMDHVIKVRDCGTSACIAGHVLINEYGHVKGRYDTDQAAEILGLTSKEGGELFFAWHGPEFTEINNNKHLMPKVLHWMADNNKINWNEAIATIPEWQKQEEIF